MLQMVASPARVRRTLAGRSWRDSTAGDVAVAFQGPARERSCSVPRRLRRELEEYERLRSFSAADAWEYQLELYAASGRRDLNRDPRPARIEEPSENEDEPVAFKPPDDPPAPTDEPTAHDFAAARELVHLWNEWKDLEKQKSPRAAFRRAVYQRAMEVQGFLEPSPLVAKLELPREATSAAIASSVHATDDDLREIAG